jgi:hypothetical protein
VLFHRDANLPAIASYSVVAGPVNQSGITPKLQQHAWFACPNTNSRELAGGVSVEQGDAHLRLEKTTAMLWSLRLRDAQLPDHLATPDNCRRFLVPYAMARVASSSQKRASPSSSGPTVSATLA